MRGKRYTTEQKIRILREADAGKAITDVCREAGVSEQTFHRWKRELGMLDVDQAKQLKELQKENARLKRMLADEILGKELLKEALKKNGKPCTQTRVGTAHGVAGQMFGAGGVPSLRAAPLDLRLSPERACTVAGEGARSCPPKERGAPGVGLPEDYAAAQT